MKKIIQIISIVLLSIMLLSSVMAVPYELSPLVVEDEPTFLESLFGSSFSTSGGPSTRFTVEQDEIIGSMSFYMYCKEASTQNRFTIDWKDVDGSYLEGERQSFTTSIDCSAKESKKITLSNIQVPDLSASSCGQVYDIMLKHERYSIIAGGIYVIDTFGSDSIDGFEKIASAQIKCQVDPCDQLTGNTFGSKYCIGDSVYIKQYTDLVRNGACYANDKVVQNCINQDCDNGRCVAKETATTINGYELVDNACNTESIKSTDSRPSNFYTSLEDCQRDIVVHVELVEGYQLLNNQCVYASYERGSERPDGFYLGLPTCESHIDTNEPVDIEQEIDDIVDDVVDDVKKSAVQLFWESIINWFKGLFSL